MHWKSGMFYVFLRRAVGLWMVSFFSRYFQILVRSTMNMYYFHIQENSKPLSFCEEKNKHGRLLVYLQLITRKIQQISISSTCVCVCIQSCLTLRDPMDCSPPGSSIPGIVQARILERVITPSSRGPSPLRDWTCVSCIGSRFFTTEPPGNPKFSVDQCQVRGKGITLRIKEKGRGRRQGFNSWVRKIPWRRARPPTPVFLPEEPQGQRSLVGCSP